MADFLRVHTVHINERKFRRQSTIACSINENMIWRSYFNVVRNICKTAKTKDKLKNTDSYTNGIVIKKPSSRNKIHVTYMGKSKMAN